ncbi:MAG: SDR family NAD(P)-dependent oxidoreductase [Nevskiaceae bacterium]|nr:MAG: SDR family NAD(P)-dependent oxidoreductase [Nevskiaceae bacterium]
MSTMNWCAQHLPDLSRRRALVTGGASGLGFQTALGLASRGAQVIVADRNIDGGRDAVARIRAQCPQARAEFRALDLADLAQIRRLAEGLNAEGAILDILVNNAGILPPLQRRTTRDGFELKFGINVLGHYALTGLLLPALRRAPAARVVWVSSLVHRHAKIDFDDLNAERRYEPQRAYNQAKLACLMLAMELHHRAAACGSRILGVAAHPGISRTAIGDTRRSEQRRRLRDYFEAAAFWLAMHGFGQEAEQGALPILRAAAGDGVRSGEFYGPDGFAEFAGAPTTVKLSKPALDAAQRARLWAECERLTGVRYEALA